MELEKAITARVSIRGFKPTPMPKKVLLEILDIARWAPSGSNFQPWEFAAVGGPVLQELREAFRQKIVAGVRSNPDVPRYASTPEIFLRRRNLNREKLWQHLGIAESTQKQEEFLGQGRYFYNAPCILFIYCDRALGAGGNLIDIGLVLQNILLVAHNRGLGCCTLASPVAYPDVARQVLGIPDTKQFIIGIAIGYIDPVAPVNTHRSGREPIQSLTTWHGME